MIKSKKWMAVALATIAAGTAAAFAACGQGENSGESTTLKISGSSSVSPLMGKLAEAYKQTREGITVTVATSDSGTGITDAQDGLNDFGMASRALKASETGLVSKQIATDGVALIVKPANTVTSVTADEVYQLYANGTPIQTVITNGIDREKGSGTRDAFTDLIKSAEGKKLKELTTLSNKITGANNTDAVKTEVAKNVALIGYISMGSLDDTVKALQFEGVEATTENVKNNSYKLSRPFNIVYKSEEGLSALAKDFIDYIMSDAGQAIVEDEGYISVK